MPQARICEVSDCGRSGKLTRGMCQRCYRAWIDRTPPDARPTAPRFAARFDDFVAKRHEGGCWTWTGKRIRKGYGMWRGRQLAHRYSWTRTNGPIPEGMWVLHHCDNPPCVNPAHLYLGTVVENVRDAIDRGRWHCPPLKDRCDAGHALAGDNLYVWISKSGQRNRQCRKCNSARNGAWQAAKRRARGLKKTRVSAEEKDTFRRLSLDGLSHRTIAKQTGRSQCTVQRVLAEAKRPTDHPSYRPEWSPQ